MSEKNDPSNFPTPAQTTNEVVRVVPLLPNIHIETFQKVSIVGNLLIAFLGLCFGVYYFFKRLKVENSRDRISRIREHSKMLLSFIDDYDKCITSSINNQSMKTMGKKRRDEISRIYKTIQHFLESNQSLIGFSEKEVQDIMEVHSIIDNSKLSRGNMAQSSQVNLKLEYHRALKRCREICWKKMY